MRPMDAIDIGKMRPAATTPPSFGARICCGGREIGDSPLKSLISGKTIDFDFLPKNLDFVPARLGFRSERLGFRSESFPADRAGRALVGPQASGMEMAPQAFGIAQNAPGNGRPRSGPRRRAGRRALGPRPGVAAPPDRDDLGQDRQRDHSLSTGSSRREGLSRRRRQPLRAPWAPPSAAVRNWERSGFKSRSGVPSTQSSPLTLRLGPSRLTSVTIDVPIGFGLTGDRIAKVPLVAPLFPGLWRTRSRRDSCSQ